MRAIVCPRYGSAEVLELRDVQKPEPRKREVLIRIHATAVTSSDIFIRTAVRRSPLAVQALMRLVVGFTKPRQPILGLVLAGEVEQTGSRVTRYRVGDRVFAFTQLHFGCYAEYTCLRESGIMGLAPSNLTYDEAAAIPYGGLLALHCLQKGRIQRGQQVLIYGASSSVGTSAVLIAKHFGAVVTGVCTAANLPLVSSLGADAVLDYTRDDATVEGKSFDLVIDAVGKRKTSALKAACRLALTPTGEFISVDDGTPRMTVSNLLVLRELAESGHIRPVIDRRYRLEQIVEAHQYVEQGHKRGNVIVTVDRNT